MKLRYAECLSGLQQWTGGTNWQWILDNGGITGYYYVQAAGSAGLFVEAAGADCAYNGTRSAEQRSVASRVGGAVSQTSVYGFAVGDTSTAADVEVYSNSGTTWTVIGGPAWEAWPGEVG